MSKTYQIIFTSNLLQGVSKSDAINNVSQIFNFPLEKVEPLISRDKPIVLKKNLSYEIAKKIEAKLTKAGLEIKLMQEPEPLIANNSSSQEFSGTDKSTNDPKLSYDNINCQINRITPLNLGRKSIKRNFSNQNREEIKYFKAWIINFILCICMAVALGILVGFIIGFVFAIARLDKNLLHILTTIIGIPCGLFSSYFLYKWSIKKYIIPQIENQ